MPGCRPGVRWPNDIEVDGRKLGGILVEGVTSGVGPRLIIGVGVNVGTRLGDAPQEVAEMAMSLEDQHEAGTKLRDPMLAAILGRLGPMLADLASGNPDLVAAWNRLDTLGGTSITVQAGDERFTAEAEGIDSTGGLRIRRDGHLSILYAGRIVRD